MWNSRKFYVRSWISSTIYQPNSHFLWENEYWPRAHFEFKSRSLDDEIAFALSDRLIVVPKYLLIMDDILYCLFRFYGSLKALKLSPKMILKKKQRFLFIEHMAFQAVNWKYRYRKIWPITWFDNWRNENPMKSPSDPPTEPTIVLKSKSRTSFSTVTKPSTLTIQDWER